MGKLIRISFSVSEDVVGGYRDRFGILRLAGVFTDLVFGERCFVDKLAYPLPDRGDVGGHDEGLGLELRDGHHADDGLARAAGESDDSAAAPGRPASVECRHRVCLVVS